MTILSSSRRRRYKRKDQFIDSSIDRDRLGRQLKRHSVALISLVVALVSLGYNTWRNETSELHRNWRQAAFVLNADLNHVRQIVLYRRYFHGREDHPMSSFQEANTWITGWGKVSAIRDLSAILPQPLPELGDELHEDWSQRAGKLDDDNDSAERAEEVLLERIEIMQREVLMFIDDLR